MKSRDRTAHEEAKRLRLGLSWREGFWIAMVAADQPEFRQGLLHDTTRWCLDNGLPMVIHELHDTTLRELVSVWQAKTAAKALHWVKLGTDRTSAAPVLRGLNQQREAWLRHASGVALVLEGPRELTTWVREEAPDLFSIRGTVLLSELEP